MPVWQELLERFRHVCHEAGLDLVHGFALPDFNAKVGAADHLHDFGRARALGLLVGNTRALWPAFVRAHQHSHLLSSSDNPLDLYVTTSVERAVAASTSAAHRSYFSHVTSPRALPIQRLAELVGFASLSPSHLAIHAEHGPWFALRAVVTLDVDGPSESAGEPARPCRGCDEPCLAALAKALAASGTQLDRRSVTAHADAWIEVRDACPVGRGSRYGDEQLRYHYGLDRQPQPHGS